MKGKAGGYELIDLLKSHSHDIFSGLCIIAIEMTDI